MAKEHTSEEIKYRHSDLGVQIGNIAIEYIADLEKQNKELVEENERLKKIEEEYFDFLQKKSEEDWKGDNIVGCLNLRIEQKDKQIEKMKSDSKTAYIKGIRTMANALKEYDRTNGAWTDYFEHTVDKVLKNLLKE